MIHHSSWALGLVLVALQAGAAAVAATPPAVPTPALAATARRWGTEELWRWSPHDKTRPVPPLAAPLTEQALAAAAQPPAGALRLLGGPDLSAWRNPRWLYRDGVLETVPKTGNLSTTQSFGSCRLHVEWSTPATPPLKSGQNRGNSGIFFMGLYEVQILDTHDNATYADGMAGAVYGQYPPRVNPVRPPGQWQYYDIEFRRPQFAADGTVTRPARLTVDFNGVRVQDDVELAGPTTFRVRRPYLAHADALPLQLQEHKEVVRFRNLWIEPLAD